MKRVEKEKKIKRGVLTVSRAVWWEEGFHTLPVFCTTSGWHLYCSLLYCSMVYCSLVYCSIVYCSMVYCTMVYCSLVYCSLLFCSMVYCSLFYCSMVYCTMIYYSMVYCTMVYCSQLYCSLASSMFLQPSVNHWYAWYWRDMGKLIVMFPACPANLSVSSSTNDALVAAPP